MCLLHMPQEAGISYEKKSPNATLSARTATASERTEGVILIQTLGLVLRNRGEEGEALPVPFESFEDVKIRMKRGQVSLWAGAPGGGKTALATYMAAHMEYSQEKGVPALYLCADSDPLTVGATVLAGIMDIPLEEAEYRLGEEDSEAFQVLENLVSHVWWYFKPSPSIDDIVTEIQAYAYVYGEYPHFIVIDNLMDLLGEENEYTRHTNNMLGMVELAKETNAHVAVLCHVVGTAQDGDRPITRSEIRNKISEKPSLVVTLYKPEDGLLGLRVVKNRSGKADTKGNYGIDLAWQASRGWFSG